MRSHRLALTAFAVGLALSAPVSASAAPTWLPQETLVDQINSPVSTMDPAGDVMMLWQAFDGTSQRIDAGFRPAGGTFTDLGFISGAGENVASPGIAMDAAGNATAVWIEQVAGKYRVETAFRPAGGTFGPALKLSDPGQDAALPQVAVNPQGDTLVAWQRSDGTNVVIQATFRPAGGSFGLPAQNLSADGQDAEDPSAAISASGAAIVGWDRPNGSMVKVAHASVMPPGGTFPTPSQSLSDAAHDAIVVKVAMDGAGNAFAVWSEPVTGPGVIMERTAPAGGSFSSSAVQNLTDPSIDSFPDSLAMNSQGQAVLAGTFVDVTSNRVIASLRPAGGAFGSFQTLSPAPGPFGQEPSAAIDPKGDAVVAWQALDGGHSTIAASAAPSGGSFPPLQTISAATTGSAVAPTVGMDALGDGEATIDWSDGSHFNLGLVGYDDAGPTLSSLFVPGSGVAGTALPFSVAATDVWSGVSLPSWSFGDGATAAGDPVTHAYTASGQHTVSVTVTDGVGNSSTATGQLTIAAGKPSISKLLIKPGSFRAAPRGGSIAKKRRTGATVSYTDTQAATTTFTVKQTVVGVRRGKRCVARKKGQKGGRRCHRLNSLGSFRRNDKAGANHFVFTGRVRRHKLRPGAYKLVLVPKSSGGTGNKVSRDFRIKR